MPELLDPRADMSAITLHVGDLEGMTEYYTRALALTTLVEEQDLRVLGRGSGASAVPVVVLRHTPGLPTPGRNQAGLFHTALLFPTEADLAAVVLSTARHPRSQYVGSADHLVSRAFYFTDPEGNGIELYHDRDRSQWRWVDGRVQMDSLYLDPQEFLSTHLTEPALEKAVEMPAAVGHVHLQVGDLREARKFYVDAIGFEATAELPGALFVAAGGYHHHIAVNTWNSRGAGPRASTLGLGEVTIAVPGREELDAVSARLKHAGLPVEDDGDVVRTEDPWRNRVALTLA